MILLCGIKRIFDFSEALGGIINPWKCENLFGGGEGGKSIKL